MLAVQYSVTVRDLVKTSLELMKDRLMTESPLSLSGKCSWILNFILTFFSSICICIFRERLVANHIGSLDYVANAVGDY